MGTGGGISYMGHFNLHISSSFVDPNLHSAELRRTSESAVLR